MPQISANREPALSFRGEKGWECKHQLGSRGISMAEGGLLQSCTLGQIAGYPHHLPVLDEKLQPHSEMRLCSWDCQCCLLSRYLGK